jgi:hypothetical protein
MTNSDRRNIDLWSVRPAELHSAAVRQRKRHARKTASRMPAGRTGKMPMFRFLPVRRNASGQTNIACHPEVDAATEGPLPRGHRHSSHVEASFESQSTFARSLTSFGMTDGKRENEILR